MANYQTTKEYAKWFARHGHAAFCFDFNGGGLMYKSDKDITKMTIFTEAEDLKVDIDLIAEISKYAGDVLKEFIG